VDVETDLVPEAVVDSFPELLDALETMRPR